MLFLVCAPVLLAGVALTVDVGSIYITRQALQNGVDAAAKAGGLELPNQKQAVAECKSCAGANKLDTADEHLLIHVMDGQNQPVDAHDNQSARRLEVKAVKHVPMTFARIFGINEWPVGARALVAMDAEPVNVITKNTVPFGLDKRLYDAQNTASVAAVPCAKENEDQVMWILPANLWPSDVEKMMVDGSQVEVAVGQHVTGSPDTIQYIDAIRNAVAALVARADASDEFSDPDNRSPNNPRIVTVPLVKVVGNPSNNGHAQMLEVVGFASFYVNSVVGFEIIGHFVDTGSTDGQVDENKPPSQGNQNGTIRAVKLIE
jgi:hypothetical protein